MIATICLQEQVINRNGEDDNTLAIMNKYKWISKEIIFETKDTLTIVFDTKDSPFTYKPGQFINITCTINGKEVSRSYSLSSSPEDKYPSITVKKVAGGIMSNYLWEQAPGLSEWAVEGPFGNFVRDTDLKKETPLIFLGGGSGITPLFSLLKEAVREAMHPPVLLYANKAPDNIIFKEPLAHMDAAEQLHAFYAFSEGDKPSDDKNCIWGRFNTLSIKSILKRHCSNLEEAHCYICGPKELMTLYKDAVLSMGLRPDQVHLEDFQVAITDPSVLDLPDESFEVLINYYDSMVKEDAEQVYEITTLIPVAPRQNLLNAAKAHRIRVPHSCESGTCGSCWARHTKGTVKMVNNFALTKEQVADSMILLCQSYALDDQVTIELD
ncbi:hypothetical protein DBR32_12455 [Taibaiella sp. KBW10]|uniref:iron-sulfur cluster-binding domain-containing protein n=1 Tax=Taibaiella sp. KBW10 TaxID=2153357 RepID=UPI000F5ABB38|nr:iron-sulfur cluster-binding domain-containing protein [Taibaiella sp. KBW10]RQO30374.1 hypothetical protein DBR32_12455 [Taibaiella sp. KBW10]